MPIVKAFDFIKTAADKAYLARCTCQGDVCQCSHDDGHTLFHTLNASSNNKGIEMTILDKMSAADRKELASKIEAAAEQMTPAERRDLIETLSAALGSDLEAKQAAERKTKVLENIQATRTDTIGTGKREYDYMQTHLRAKGVTEPLSELVWKTEQEIDAIFAASSPRLALGLPSSLMCGL